VEERFDIWLVVKPLGAVVH